MPTEFVRVRCEARTPRETGFCFLPVGHEGDHRSAPDIAQSALDVRGWIERTLALPVYEKPLPDSFGQGVVEALRTLGKLLDRMPYTNHTDRSTT